MKLFTKITVLAVLAVMVMCTASFAQEITVTGTVTEAGENKGLAGVTIIEKGTTNGFVTDLDGNYIITINEGATLVASFIGFLTQEIEVGNRTTIDITMEIDVETLEEIVVIGYGAQRKSDLTGAVSLADPEEMQKQATNDLTQALQGRVPGVAITSDGQPGATPSVRIRGVSTFGGAGATAEPLYVVDGVPLIGGIRDFNPNNIESIQVLKDATAGAIYGNRAANGVVIITTKKGNRNQPFTIEVGSYTGIQTLPFNIPVLRRENYQLIANELFVNAGRALIPGNDPSSPLFIDDVDTDWQDVGYKEGSISNVNINFNGGGENTTYFMSLDYLNNEGTLEGTGPNYERFSFRVNTETEIGRVKFGENLLKVRSNENPLYFGPNSLFAGGSGTLAKDLVSAIPTMPFRDENRLGGFGGADAVIHNAISLNVPGVNTLIENSSLVDRTLANVWGEVNIVEGLSYRLNLSYDQTTIQNETFIPEYDLGFFFPNPLTQLIIRNINSNSFLIENTLNYRRTFGKHKINALAGQSYQDDYRRSITSTGSGFEQPFIRNLFNATDVSVGDNIQESTLYSLFGRINYVFDDRYLLTFNIRRDGSSKFAEDNRFELFPSVGLAWKVHNDIQLPSIISDLKIRMGIGQVGNQFINNYSFQQTINRGIPYEFAGERVLGGAVTTLVDQSIKWETRTTRNIGFDATLFEGKVQFSAEYYQNTSDDVLLPLPIPQSVGSVSSSIITNAGSIENSGIELSGTFIQDVGDFNIQISPNFYTLNNEIVDLGPLDNLPGNGTFNEVGRSIGEHFGWVFDGIFQSQDEVDAHATQFPGTSTGDIRFRDIAGPPDQNGNPSDPDGVVDENDRTYLGQGIPTYYYGISITAGYKNFDFTIFGSGSGGNLVNNSIYKSIMNQNPPNWHEDILDRWTQENPGNSVPRMISGDPNDNGRNSDRPGWLQDGDYFRINTISLGYTLPTRMVGKIGATSIRFYGTVQNLTTFTAYKGYNPDFQSGILNPGFDPGSFPRPTTSIFGVQIKF